MKEKSEADIIKLTKLNVAWDCAYSIEDWELCDIISKRIGIINGVEL